LAPRNCAVPWQQKYIVQMLSYKQRTEKVRLQKLVQIVISAVSARPYGTQATAQIWRAVERRNLRNCVAMSGGIRAIYIFE
jgi:hypothetical protein